MLMGRGLGTTPSNFTLPLTLAAPGVLAAEKGLPALTDWPLHMQIAVTEIRRITFFVFMTSQLPWTHPMLLSAKLPAKVDGLGFKIRESGNESCRAAVTGVSFVCRLLPAGNEFSMRPIGRQRTSSPPNQSLRLSASFTGCERLV